MKVDKDRIKELIRKKSLKQKEVAEAIGTTQQNWNNWMFRSIFPQHKMLEQVAEILEVNVSELYASKNKSDEPLAIYKNQIRVSNDEIIPLYDLDLKSEVVQFLTGKSTTILPKDHLHIPGLKADFFFTYYGKGMTPEIDNGDLVAVRRITDFDLLQYGNPHLVVTSDQTFVRNLKSSDKTGHYKLCSSKDNQEESLIGRSSIKALFMVMSVIRRFVI